MRYRCIDPPKCYYIRTTLAHPNCVEDGEYIRDVDRRLSQDLAHIIAENLAKNKTDGNGRVYRELSVIAASEDEFWEIVERAAMEFYCVRKDMTPAILQETGKPNEPQ